LPMSTMWVPGCRAWVTSRRPSPDGTRVAFFAHRQQAEHAPDAAGWGMRRSSGSAARSSMVPAPTWSATRRSRTGGSVAKSLAHAPGRLKHRVGPVHRPAGLRQDPTGPGHPGETSRGMLLGSSRSYFGIAAPDPVTQGRARGLSVMPASRRWPPSRDRGLDAAHAWRSDQREGRFYDRALPGTRLDLQGTA
jgi:hypothetical protein